jgi:hypothetical protein
MLAHTPVFAPLSARRSPFALIVMMAIVSAAIVLMVTPVESAAAAGPAVLGQVQLPLPSFNFDPTKWVQDAFGALLQTFSDGIRAGLDALWAANFIPKRFLRCPARTTTFAACMARCNARPMRR